MVGIKIIGSMYNRIASIKNNENILHTEVLEAEILQDGNNLIVALKCLAATS